MKKYLFLFLFFPFLTFASQGWTGVSFEDNNFNGQYCDNSTTYAGFPVFENSEGMFLYNNSSADRWFLDETSGEETNWTYIDVISASEPPSVDNWFVFPYPNSTSGYMTSSTCGGGESGGSVSYGSSTTATTTGALLGSIAFGLAVLIALVSLFVFATIYGMITKKKPWL